LKMAKRVEKVRTVSLSESTTRTVKA